MLQSISCKVLILNKWVIVPLREKQEWAGNWCINCYNILSQKENLKYYSVNFSQKHCFISSITNKNSKIRIKIYKRYKATYISAFCMQTTAHANLCNSPPERSSTFRSFRWVKSTKNIALCSMLKFYFTSSWQNVYYTSFWVWMMSQL